MTSTIRVILTCEVAVSRVGSVDNESSIGCTCDHLFSFRITLARVFWCF